MIRKFIQNILFYLKKNKYTFAPVFIIGCGRSGTTILGETLSKHSEIKYLNERRDLWHKHYPEFNIWESKTNNPKLIAKECDVSAKRNLNLRKLFFKLQVLNSSKILLEKLPINSFRLRFLEKSFPEAKYIYLTRNGLEVSKSIEKKIEKKKWLTGSKFELLVQHYKEEFSDKSNLSKAMLEWKLSISESDNFFRKLDTNKFIHLSYEDLVEHTESSLIKIFKFLQLKTNNNFLETISKNINRRNKKISNTDDENLSCIGGELLKQSINNTYSPF